MSLTKEKQHKPVDSFYFLFLYMFLVPLFFSFVDDFAVKETLYFGGRDLL
jgi:fucose 4-O-acetylase-like acetyltransferase